LTRAIIPIVLSGGSGTRLWPLSRESRPKQFLPLVTDATLFQETLTRLRHVRAPLAPPAIVCNERHGGVVLEQLHAIGVAPGAVILEPAGRNSCPAVTVAALLLQARADAGDDPFLLVLPADHVVQDSAAFAAAVGVALEPARAGYLVTFGVVPDHAATGYGYLRAKEPRDGWSLLDQFVEKPDRATAETYLASGRYLWNSGIFLFSIATLRRELEAHAAPLLAACERAVLHAVREGPVTRLGADFLACEAISIDYALMEKTQRGAVVPLAAGWSDVGSWNALHDVLPKDANGNVVAGNVLIESCKNTYVSAQGRLVAAVGLDGIVIVETDDAVLVVAREHAERIKGVVEELQRRARGPAARGEE
jgi:mannose-1-phosphate guanylyltransferase/mannose-6-phosphate isomerase